MSVCVESKPPITLRVDGHALGYVQDVTWTRDVKELPEKDGYRQYAPGDYPTCDVSLRQPACVREKYVLLDEGELVKAGDQRWSAVLCVWLTVHSSDIHPDFTRIHIVRRKALVLV